MARMKVDQAAIGHAPNEQGLQPNQFSQSYQGSKRVDLPAPAERSSSNLPSDEASITHQRATRAEGEHARRMETLGWSGEGLEGHWRGRFSGAQEHFPNMGAAQGNRAINEPHQRDMSVPVMRRWEDMSADEQATGQEHLRRQGYGSDTESPMDHFVRSKEDANYRHVARNNMAGVNESSVQHFYGGAPITTKIPDEGLQKAHNDSMTLGPGKFDSMVDQIGRSEGFQASAKAHGVEDTHLAARSVAAKAVADTSPQLKFYQPKKNGEINWPNLESARSAVHGAMTGTDPYKHNPNDPSKNLQGTDTNRFKARDNINQMMESGDYDTAYDHAAGKQRDISPKTGPFNGAVINPNSADSFAVEDVHESNSKFPGGAEIADQVSGSPGTRKSEMVYSKNGRKATQKISGRAGSQTVTPRMTPTGPGYHAGKAQVYADSAGKKVSRFPDEPESKVAGMTRVTGPDGKPQAGQSRGEQSIDGVREGLDHAMNDYATRRSNANMGISRGVNYADNVHATQAARWGGEQLDRLGEGVEQAHGHAYPVIRDNGPAKPVTEMIHAQQHGGNLSGIQFSGLGHPGYKANPHMDNRHDPSRDPRTGGYL